MSKKEVTESCHHTINPFNWSYLASHEFATRARSVGLWQKQCEKCKLWLIWSFKGKMVEEIPDDFLKLSVQEAREKLICSKE